MDAKQFLAEFGHIVNAPGGVKRLREMVLLLGVSGRLVQNSKEQSAAVLAESIKSCVENEAHKRRIRWKKYYGCFSFDFPLEIPKNWELVKLNDFALINMGQSPDSSSVSLKKGDGLPFYQGKTEFGELYPTPRKWCSSPKKIATKDDILISVRAPVGPTNLCLEDSCIGRGITAISTINGAEKTYLLYVLRAVEKLIAGLGVGSTFVAISQKDLQGIPVPVPPLKEQKRIVAKVDELMALCDTLEDQQQKRQQVCQITRTTALDALANAQSPQELHHAWHRVQSNMPLLFDGPESASDIRQEILALGVQGALTRFCPLDEDVDELLYRASNHKLQLLNKKVIRREEPENKISDEEKGYEIKNSWRWVRLVDTCSLITDGTHQTPKYTQKGKPFISAQNVKPFWFNSKFYRYVSEEDFVGYRKNRQPEKNDVLLTRVGAGIGEAALIDTDLEFAIYVSVALLKPLNFVIDPVFLVCWLNSPFGREYSLKKTLGIGVSQGNLNLAFIKRRFRQSIV